MILINNNFIVVLGIVIRYSNVLIYEVCEKFCKEEKRIKCLFIKYISEKKMCYFIDKDIMNMVVIEGLVKLFDLDEK